MQRTCTVPCRVDRVTRQKTALIEEHRSVSRQTTGRQAWGNEIGRAICLSLWQRSSLITSNTARADITEDNSLQRRRAWLAHSSWTLVVVIRHSLSQTAEKRLNKFALRSSWQRSVHSGWSANQHTSWRSLIRARCPICEINTGGPLPPPYLPSPTPAPSLPPFPSPSLPLPIPFPSPSP